MDLNNLYNSAITAVNNGNADKMYTWKILIFDGIMGFPMDIDKGFNQLKIWLQSTNIKVRATALSIMGDIFFQGNYGVDKNIKLAFECETQAEQMAQLGNDYILGYCYLHGVGGAPKDLTKAKHYIVKSANDDIAPAIQIKNQMGW